jgi:hypothetical protein
LIVKKGVSATPELVAQLDFLEWTEANQLRNSKFVGLREDKDPRTVVKEQGGSPIHLGPDAGNCGYPKRLNPIRTGEYLRLMGFAIPRIPQATRPVSAVNQGAPG